MQNNQFNIANKFDGIYMQDQEEIEITSKLDQLAEQLREFPVLGSTAENKKSKTSFKPGKNGRKFVLVRKTHINNSGDSAQMTSTNKLVFVGKQSPQLEQSHEPVDLTRTQACKYGNKCKKDGCTYAHSWKELRGFP